MSSILSQVLNNGRSQQEELTAEVAHASAIDMAEANMGVLQDNAEMTRLMDVANGLDNVVAVAAHTTSASRVELALVENSVALALAGENFDPSHATFGLESCEGQTIACEGIKDVAIKIWTAIKNVMKRIRDRVVKFFKSRFGAVASLRKSLEKLKERNDKAIGKSIEESKTNLGREAKALYVAGSMIKAEADVVRGCESIKADAEGLFFDFTKKVNATGDAISSAMDGFNSSDKTRSEEALTAANAAATKLVPPIFTAVMAGKSDGDNRVPASMTAVKKDLFFNQAIFTMTPTSASSSNKTLREKAETYAKSRLMITNTSEKPKDLNDEATIATWSTGTIDSIVTALLDGLEALERFEGSSEYKDITSVNKDIQKAGDSIAKDIAAEDDLNSDVNDAAKGLRALAAGYARWSSEGYTQYASYILNVGNAMSTIANKCLSNYK